MHLQKRFDGLQKAQRERGRVQSCHSEETLHTTELEGDRQASAKAAAAVALAVATALAAAAALAATLAGSEERMMHGVRSHCSGKSLLRSVGAGDAVIKQGGEVRATLHQQSLSAASETSCLHACIAL